MVHFKRTYNARVITYGNVQIHLVDYRLPDGTIGRGFVNEGLTWSFLGERVNSINDDDLCCLLRMGMVIPALEAGTVQTTFVSSGEEPKYFPSVQPHTVNRQICWP